ncbi:MAG: TIGR00341 family protein [Phaeodactylibacter sp.]|nr:TIGR00341 family protein [Phaeodactylibacter sp.]MCB9048085.1 TIGR00341 family protein [Lewinellaceae bacterium]
MPARTKVTARAIARDLRLFLKDRFNLDDDKASERETIEEIEKGVVFRGTNLWILIFAIMVASVGLNVNSPAVVIGAMLISPLMGPIMGIGLGVGINDLELIVKALRNLGIAVAISVLTSAAYFWISPLNDAQSELLARTSPTLWDVLIALFGGLAGIVAGSRKEKSNAIPGVAIATALMPPLCTAGFGLATAQWNYFFGAFYLFFINSVFISFSTYLIVRLLRFKSKDFVDKARELRVRRLIAVFIILTIIPSIYTAYKVVNQSLFERYAQQFITQEMRFDNCQVINKNFTYEQGEKQIEVTLFGEPIDEAQLQELEKRLPDYNLPNARLIVRQGYTGEDSLDLAAIERMNLQMRTGIIEDLYKKNEEILRGKDDRIRLLQDEILRMHAREVPIADFAEEVKAINKNVLELSVSPAVLSRVDSARLDTLHLAYAHFKRKPRTSEIKQLEDWLKARVKTEKLRLVVE